MRPASHRSAVDEKLCPKRLTLSPGFTVPHDVVVIHIWQLQGFW